MFTSASSKEDEISFKKIKAEKINQSNPFLTLTLLEGKNLIAVDSNGKSGKFEIFIKIPWLKVRKFFYKKCFWKETQVWRIK
jgi:hypothetical protein